MSVEKVRDSNGRVIQATARWRDPAGVQRKKTFKGDNSLRRATKHEAKMVSDRESGDYLAPDKATVIEVARKYVDSRSYRGETLRRARGRLNALAETPLGKRRIQHVEFDHVQAWAKQRATELADSTMKVELVWLRSVFKYATKPGPNRKPGVLRVSPFEVEDISLPTKEGTEKLVPYSIAEIEAIAAKLPPRLRLLPYLQAGVGPRIAEALALRVPQEVDVLGRVVRIRKQLHPTLRTREPLKTESSLRDVPLPAVTGKKIAAHIAEFGLGLDGELFTMDDGKTSWAYNRVRELMNDALEAADARDNAGGPTHCFRHSYASLLLAAGESVIAVAQRLGHKNAGLVLSTYGHLMAGADDRTRKAIDDAWKAEGSSVTESASDVPDAGEQPA